MCGWKIFEIGSCARGRLWVRLGTRGTSRRSPLHLLHERTLTASTTDEPSLKNFATALKQVLAKERAARPILGLSLDDARCVVRFEVERCTAIRRMQEAGL